MQLSEIKKLPNLKIINSTESICYVNDNTIYKIFKGDENIEEKIEIINTLISSNIDGLPKIYDYIYDNNKVVGYSMKYYKNIKSFSDVKNFKLIKQKCIELIEIYKKIKDEHNLCYYDFHKDNIYIYNGKILLLDIDSCLKNTHEIEKLSLQQLKEFIISLLYKTYYFEYETYFTYPEQTYIRNILLQNIDKDNLTEYDLKTYINQITKKDTKRTLKKIPYKIK